MNRKLNIVNIFFSMLIALTMILTSVKPIMALSSSPQSKRSDGDLRGGGYSQIGKFPFDGGGRILTQQVQNRIGALGGKFTANVLDIAEQFHTSLGILGRQLLIPTELTRYVDGISGVDVGDCQMIVSPCKSNQ